MFMDKSEEERKRHKSQNDEVGVLTSLQFTVLWIIQMYYNLLMFQNFRVLTGKIGFKNWLNVHVCGHFSKLFSVIMFL